MEDLVLIDPSEKWPKYEALVKANVGELNGATLVDYVKEVQALEQQILQAFEAELAKMDPAQVTEQNLKLIDNYNNILTQLDLAHRRATEHYQTLPDEQKSLFMEKLLPDVEDKSLFDKFVKRATPSFGSVEQKQLSQSAFKSDVLKLLATEEGYKNIKTLNDHLEANNNNNCSKIIIVLKKGAISQSYFAVRARGSDDPTQETFKNPGSLPETAPLQDYLDIAKTVAPTIKKTDIPKPNRINTSLEIQLHYPYPENLNKTIIKIGKDDTTGKPRFIYSPRFVSLHHEFNHTVRMFDGVNLEWAKAPPSFNHVYKNMEEFAVIQVENALRERMGLTPRITHSGITYDPDQEEAIKKFREASIDMYFRALIEMGTIPEDAVDMDPQKLKALTVDQKLDLIVQYTEVQQEQKGAYNENTEYSSWTSAKPHSKFETIKEETSLLSHPLYALLQQKLLDVSSLSNMSDQEIKNLSHPVIKDAILLGEMSVDFAKQLTDQQIQRLAKSETSTFNNVLLEIKEEVRSKNSQTVSEMTTPIVPSQNTDDTPEIKNNLSKQ